MQKYAEGAANRRKALKRQCRRWHHARPPNKNPASGPYRDRVAASPDVNRTRFARFIRRTLDAAHDRGMTDADIHEATGVPSSTFHRWARGAFRTAPDLDKVRRFCAGLDASLPAAMAALGVTDQRDQTEPDPPLPPEIRVLLRALTDPNETEANKRFIRESLRMLADRAQRPSRRRGGDTEAG